MMNRVVLVGRLTKDPDLRYTTSGVAVANFTLAVGRNFKNAAGEQETDFIQCQVWRKPAENVANYLKKGSLAGVDGKIQTRNYDGTDGKRVYVTEIVAESVQFLDSKKDGQAAGQNGGNSSQNNQGGTNTSQNSQNSNIGQNRGQDQLRNNGNDDPFAGNGQIDIQDDDLPF